MPPTCTITVILIKRTTGTHEFNGLIFHYSKILLMLFFISQYIKNKAY